MRILITKSTLVALLMVMVLSGCNGQGAVKNSDPLNAMVDTRACYYGTFEEANTLKKSETPDEFKTLGLGAIGSVLAAGLLDKGFDMVSLALKKAAGAENLKSATVRTAGYQYVSGNDTEDTSRLKATIVVAHGLFANSAKVPAKPLFLDSRTVPQPDEAVKEAKKRLGVSDESLLLLCDLEYSDTVTAFRLIPKYLYYNGGLGTKNYINLGTKNDINLVVNFTFRLPSKPSAEASTTAFAGTQLVFNSLEQGTTLKNTALASKATEWMPLPEVKNKKLVRIPVVAEIQLVEAKEPNKLLLLMSEAFESKKEDLVKEVSATIKIDGQ